MLHADSGLRLSRSPGRLLIRINTPPHHVAVCIRDDDVSLIAFALDLNTYRLPRHFP